MIQTVCVIACVHGNEPYGKAVVRKLQRLALRRGKLTVLIAHPRALRRNVRYIDEDLNRCFPGKKNGTIEERIAHRLVRILGAHDIVIDLHSSSTPTEPFAIVTKRTRRHRELLATIPVPRAVIMTRRLARGRSLIDHCALGVSLEMGKHDDPRIVSGAVKTVKEMLAAQGMLSQPPSRKRRTILYAAYDLTRQGGRPARRNFSLMWEKGKRFYPFLITPPEAGNVAYVKARKIVRW